MQIKSTSDAQHALAQLALQESRARRALIDARRQIDAITDQLPALQRAEQAEAELAKQPEATE